MKKRLSLLLVLALTLMLFLASCGETNTDTDTNTETKTESESGTSTSTDTETEVESETEVVSDTETEVESSTETESKGLALRFDPTTDTYKVAGIGVCKDSTLIIPRKHNGKNVTSIEDFAFENCEFITSVVIPNNILTIGAFAFEECINLNSIVLGEGVVSIGEYAFTECYKLLEVYNLSTLPITINDAEETNGGLGYYAKVINTSLQKESIISTTDDGYVFAAINEDEIYLIDYIGYDLFNYNLPKSYNGKNYEIYQFAFYCEKYLETVYIPSAVSVIGKEAFFNCDLLTSVTIDVGIREIHSEAFSGCNNLKSINLPNSIISIQDRAFRGTDLSDILIPTSVENMEESIFDDCDGVIIFCESEIKPNGWSSSWDYMNRPVYWYSENEPTAEGNYWHYGDNGEIVIWEEI